MSAQAASDTASELVMRGCIQKVATGPEYSKDLSFDEAHAAMRTVLEGRADPVQTAVFLIALRMKRETDDENAGVLQAIMDSMQHVTAEVDEVLDIADPYDGYTRGLAISPFLPPVFAACGLPAVSHGVESLGPKYGATHRKVLAKAGINVDRDANEAAGEIANPDIGWSYIDQKAFCPALHDLIPLRTRIVKRPVLTTVEVLTGPVRGRQKTHLMTGYVHKAYPPVYANLARQAGFDTAAIIRGVEGGVIPSLKQPAKVFCYHDRGEESPIECYPDSIGIDQPTRAVPIPADTPSAAQQGDEIATTVDIDAAAEAAAATGIEALGGQAGPAHDSLVYAAAIVLHHLGRHESLASAADAVRRVLASGEALARFKAAT
jgi:anthranilate phosphoribosyltransferase